MKRGSGPLSVHRSIPIALVTGGGAVGAACREGISLAIPGRDEVSLLIVNVVGAFLLGYLYQAVIRLGSQSPRAKNLKLLLGTGFCGGFTTYSSLAADSAMLLRDGRVWTTAAYTLGTVLVGACATWLGILLAGTANRSASAPTSSGSTS